MLATFLPELLLPNRKIIQVLKRRPRQASIRVDTIDGKLKETVFNDIQIKKIITEVYNNALVQKNFTVLIESTDNANYKNFADIFDDVSLSQNHCYGYFKNKTLEKKVYETIAE